MKSGAALRAAAAAIVDAVVSKGRSLDAALASREHAVAVADRSLVRFLCYGTLRHHWRLEDWLAQLLDRPMRRRDSEVQALLRIGLYQLHGTRVPDHAVVSATVEATRLLRRPKLAGLVNAVLRRAQRDRIFERAPSNEEARFDHPQWLIDAIRTDWPDDWQELLAANNARAPMWLRVNLAQGSRAEYAGRMAEAGIASEPLTGAPAALRLAQAAAVDGLPGFEAGHVSVQDGAAQLAAPWLLAGIEGRVLDACAAPGGKSAHLKELGGDRIDLTCIDSDADRLGAVAANLDRLGLDATLTCGDASNPETWGDKRSFAAILLDAPCSASGVIRRHPDITLLRRSTDIAALARTQSRLLHALWRLLEPGGRLLYVTCSVLAAENDAGIAAFLGEHADAREEDVLHDNNIRDLMRRKACGFQVLPGMNGLDGFYFAGLVKDS